MEQGPPGNVEIVPDTNKQNNIDSDSEKTNTTENNSILNQSLGTQEKRSITPELKQVNAKDNIIKNTTPLVTPPLVNKELPIKCISMVSYKYGCVPCVLVLLCLELVPSKHGTMFARYRYRFLAQLYLRDADTYSAQAGHLI